MTASPRYLSVLPVRSDTEKEEVAVMLHRDDDLTTTIDKIINIGENGRAGSWGSFLGFREVSGR